MMNSDEDTNYDTDDELEHDEQAIQTIQANEIKFNEINFNEIQRKTKYEDFLNDCCEIGDGKYCFTEDIRLAFRIWSKNTDKVFVNKFFKFLKQRFRTGVEHVNYMKRNVYRGICLKPFKVYIENEKPYHEFISTKCEMGYHNRISFVDFLLITKNG